MTLLVFTVLLWGSTAVLGVLAVRRGEGSFIGGLRDAVREAGFIAPRLLVGVMGAGFIAELLPPETMQAFLGEGSGSFGILTATIAGAVIPGGPVVVFAIGGAALDAGAGTPQILAFLTGWLVYSINRTFVWEVPILGAHYVRGRIILSSPIPLAVGHLALLAPL